MEWINFLIYILTMCGFYSILSLSLNFQYGFGGLVNFGQIGFFAIGAYTSAIITTQGFPFIIGLIFSGIVASLVGLIVAFPTRRLSVHYWSICTLAIAEVIRLFALNERWLTGGPFGLSGIPQPKLLITSKDLYPIFYLLLVLIVAYVTFIIFQLIINSPFGIVMRTLREDDDLPLALGKDVFKFRIKIMILGTFFAGISGCLYAHFVTFISPMDFLPLETFIIWAMVIIGGKGNNYGAIVGSIIVVLFYNSTRFLKDYINISTQLIASLRMVIIGFLIVMIVLFLRNGIIPEKKQVYDLEKLGKLGKC